MESNMHRIHRTDRELIQNIIAGSNQVNNISEADQAEMAIPSYLNANPLIRAIFWRRYDRIYRLAELASDMVVCEFGCGIGAFLPTLSSETAQVYAVDLFPQYAEALARELNLSVTFSRELSSVPDGSLDVLFAVEVMEHLHDPVAYLKLFAKKLKPSGRLIMSGPTESTLYKIGRFMVGYNKYHDYHEHNVYELVEVITANGFELERTIRYPSPVLPLNLICSFTLEDQERSRVIE
ncbi:class I SAM-dependent methyltransferase [bacterium]|nr:class I SAM-dependent methyltransferase [bacterium]